MTRVCGALAIGLALTVMSSSAWTQAAVDGLELAAELARHGVAGGAVVPASDFSGWVPPRAVPSAEEKEAFRDGLPAVAEAFAEARSEYSVTLMDSVVHVRSAREPAAVQVVLDGIAVVPDVESISVRDALYKLVLGAMTGQEPTGGIVGTGRQPVEACSLDRLIRVSGGSMSPARLLDQIVGQLSGVVWVVTYDEERPNNDLKVGFICRGGARTTLTVF